MDCSTIIVSYNTFDLTREAILAALDSAQGLKQEVIVVDNNSPDQSGIRLQEAFPLADYPSVHIIINPENRGFATANNQGATQAQGEVLYFLNSDTVAYPRSTRRLHDFLQTHPEAGAVGPRVYNPDGTDQHSAIPFRTPARLLRHYLPLADLLRGKDHRTERILQQTKPADVIKGCALALRRDVFDEVGGWDESYFLYSEETELCFTLVQAGYTNYYVREAEIMHYGGASTKQENYAKQQIIQARSAKQFLGRHYGRGMVILNRVAGMFGFAGRAIIFSILARLHPKKVNGYHQRRQAASALWRWFLWDYA